MPSKPTYHLTPLGFIGVTTALGALIGTLFILGARIAALVTRR